MPKLAAELQADEAILLFDVVNDYLLSLARQGEHEKEIPIRKIRLALTTREKISDEKLLAKVLDLIDWVLPKIKNIQDGWRLMDIRQKIEGAASLQVVATAPETADSPSKP
jgi:hypothetical protein